MGETEEWSGVERSGECVRVRARLDCQNGTSHEARKKRQHGRCNNRRRRLGHILTRGNERANPAQRSGKGTRERAISVHAAFFHPVAS